MALTLKAFKFAQYHDKRKHVLSILPFLCTFSNAIFGFLAMISAIENNLMVATYCLLIAIIMDTCDGRLARALNSCSYLGLELDSLCDAVSFCIAPAILLYQWSFNSGGVGGLAVLLLYISCGLYRLARFNVHHHTMHYFKGLPTTMAAFFIATLIYYESWLINSPLSWMIHNNYLVLIITFISILMISPLYFPSYKRNTIAFNIACIIACIVTLISIRQGYPLLLLGCIAYIINGFIGTGLTLANYFQALKSEDH